jgi:multidrug efflux system membrane fusion protein
LLSYIAGEAAPMRRKIAVRVILLLALLAGGGAYAFMHGSGSKTAQPSAPPPVPVVGGTVAQHDVPIYLTGVGTVVAYNTDIVRSQIQGQIVSINFTEGQTVHAGDLLAQIDPRPYQAQVDQFTANRDRDQAQIMNARDNLNSL